MYGASLPYMPRGAATALTFFVSALLHELIMGCITKKLRGYGFFAMMSQIPIVAVQRSPIFRGHDLLNNIMFWISMISGLSLVGLSPCAWHCGCDMALLNGRRCVHCTSWSKNLVET